ncbi:P27 family phage terminase small subunit [Singulisphaera sp. Ch08]|uniref:P27 family phage terminase small subunit n=1 Tax=Singulisphaera sp. Ch08 TaxID=3120278 RepID=UPI003872D090
MAGVLSVNGVDAVELCCRWWERWQETEAKVKEPGQVHTTSSGYACPIPWLKIATAALKDLK